MLVSFLGFTSEDSLQQKLDDKENALQAHIALAEELATELDAHKEVNAELRQHVHQMEDELAAALAKAEAASASAASASAEAEAAARLYAASEQDAAALEAKVVVAELKVATLCAQAGGLCLFLL